MSLPSADPSRLPPLRLADYSHVFLENGARRQPQSDTLPHLLCFETGHYGLVLDLSDLTSVRFGRFDGRAKSIRSYTDCLQQHDRQRMEGQQHELYISLSVNKIIYRVKSCSLTNTTTPYNGKVLLWESGRFVQHVTLQHVECEKVQGDDASCAMLNGISIDLDIVVWPKSFTLTLVVNGKLGPERNDGVEHHDFDVEMRLLDWTVKRVNNDRATTLSCQVIPHISVQQQVINIKVTTTTTNDERSVPVVFDQRLDCHVATVEYGHNAAKYYVRSFPAGYTDIRNYDEFTVRLSNSSTENVYVPFLLYLIHPANVTGMCPMICTATTGEPTGIPMQLSKNWHHKAIGPYLRGYTLLPVPAQSSQTSFLIRIVYGFYGTLPAASHAQLSLVGCQSYSGRWEQLSIGCFGETFCLDPETSWVTNTITDLRGLMLRNGPNGTKWQWTDCGWGGDWLGGIKDENGALLTIVNAKTGYVSHGPCLTDVCYAGSYGDRHQVNYTVRVRTCRTDDCARTFHSVEYNFRDNVTVFDGWLLMSRTRGFVAPSFAYGSRNGLLRMCSVDDGLSIGEIVLEDTTLEGNAPFWFSLPDSHQFQGKDWGTGTKHWIIRSYHAEIGGVCYRNPSLLCSVFCTFGPDRKPGLEVQLRPPPGVVMFRDGDLVRFDVEWMTTPRAVEDYYGPNDALRSFLKEYPRSWEVPFREALGNDLQVNVTGGMLQSHYPVSIRALNDECVDVHIIGGVGYCPIEFLGLCSTQYCLYEIIDGREWDIRQGVHGNDYWQVDYDEKEERYVMAFNVGLDKGKSSLWRLRKRGGTFADSLEKKRWNL
jgi:hypothetical protein